MKIKFSKIFTIILISVLLSFIYNHFNSNGLELIKVEKKLDWESDFQAPKRIIDSSFVDTSLNKSRSLDTAMVNKREKAVESFKEPKAIKLDFAYKLFKEGIQFIDSRSSEEFAEGHVKGAVSIPFYGSENYLNEISRLDKNKIVVTYCSSAECDISILSGDELFEMGFKRVYVFIGGYDEWTKNNYPTSKK